MKQLKVKIPVRRVTEKEVLVNFQTSKQKRDELKQFCKENGLTLTALFNSYIDQILEAR